MSCFERTIGQMLDRHTLHGARGRARDRDQRLASGVGHEMQVEITGVGICIAAVWNVDRTGAGHVFYPPRKAGSAGCIFILTPVDTLRPIAHSRQMWTAAGDGWG